jgi:hypothetical protein
MAEWRGRPQDRVYPVIFIGAIVVKVRDGQVVNRPINVVIGVSCSGERDILGLWAGDGGEGRSSGWRCSPRSRTAADAVSRVATMAVARASPQTADTWRTSCGQPALITYRGTTELVHFGRPDQRPASRGDRCSPRTRIDIGIGIGRRLDRSGRFVVRVGHDAAVRSSCGSSRGVVGG